MIKLEIGQHLNVGEDKYLVCDFKKYKNSDYVLLYNKTKDLLNFYKVIDLGNEEWEFERVNSPEMFKKLSVSFADFDELIRGDNNEV